MTSSKHMNVIVPRSGTDVPDTHDMVVIHRIFRREFHLLAEVVGRTAAGDIRRVVPVAEHLEFCLAALCYHHSTEDEYLWPLLVKRSQP